MFCSLLDSTSPTPPVPTNFSLMAGAFELIYVAANDLPEQLRAETVGQITTFSVPDGGATLSLLGFALVGLGALRRKYSV